jgi:hypothetical protein
MVWATVGKAVGKGVAKLLKKKSSGTGETSRSEVYKAQSNGSKR